MRLISLLVALLLPLAAVAAEPSAADLQRARAHYEAGSGLYQLGRYDEAIGEFSAGYALSHRPQFALNIGQCYRMLGRFEDARDMIRRFLDEAPADAPERPSATALLAETEQQIRARAAPAAASGTPPPSSGSASSSPSSSSLTSSSSPSSSSLTSSSSSLTSSSPPSRHRHRVAIALGVTGAVLAVGAALTVGLVLGLSSDAVPPTSLGAVRFTP